MIHYKTQVTDVGPEAFDLLDGGVLVLYADGAPAALAEISVQHREVSPPSPQGPSVGSKLSIGSVQCEVCAVGSTAWAKVKDLGHVVVNFNGASVAQRPGEICVFPVEQSVLRAQLEARATIELSD